MAYSQSRLWETFKGRRVPRRNRSFTAEDIIRLSDENLSALEQAEVQFEFRFGRMRELMEAGRGFDEEDFRMLNKFIQRLTRIRGNR